MKCQTCETKMDLVPRKKDEPRLTRLYHECPQCGEVHEDETAVRCD